MYYVVLTYLHLATVVPAFLVGTYILLNQKGTPTHRTLGKLFMILMLSTAFISLFMSGAAGPGSSGTSGSTTCS